MYKLYKLYQNKSKDWQPKRHHGKLVSTVTCFLATWRGSSGHHTARTYEKYSGSRLWKHVYDITTSAQHTHVRSLFVSALLGCFPLTRWSPLLCCSCCSSCKVHSSDNDGSSDAAKREATRLRAAERRLRVYTRTGDRGTSSLYTGDRRPKADIGGWVGAFCC